MKIKIFLIFVLVSVCNTLCGQLPTPNASLFLPGPPEDTSVEYLKDYSQYVWGKSMRNTSGWQNASTDINFQLSTYINAFSPLIGLEISNKNTPYIYKILDYIMTYGQITIENANKSWFVLPPYERFNEKSLVPTYEEKYSDISSYPSSFALMGWLTALTLIEICPDKQDDVLVRGFKFGTSSIIAGYNWDSDAISGRLLACALSAYMHNHAYFNELLKYARTEYEQKTGINNTIITTDPNSPFFPNEDLPDAIKYLPEPPAIESVSFSYDLNQHIINSRKRSTSEGKTAVADVDVSADYMVKIFSNAFGKTISRTETPHIYNLISRVHKTGSPAYNSAKQKYMRTRPYVLLNEKTSYAPDEESGKTNGSYPSGHSSEGWLVAMVLAEINSDKTEDILARAYQYGQSRVITGYHWQSDVDAGRLVASTVYAHLHACDEFMTMMEQAKKEFNGATSTRAVLDDNKSGGTTIYKLDGTRVEGTPSNTGIYIQGNKKIVIK